MKKLDQGDSITSGSQPGIESGDVSAATGVGNLEIGASSGASESEVGGGDNSAA